MKRLALALLAAAAATAGCTTPGTGWSRAPDLAVYEAMGSYADIAREQAVLCDGSRPGRVDASWDAEFGAREAAVQAAMVSRYGAEAVDAAAAAREPRVPCEPEPDKWRHRYVRLLRLLEARLGLA